jgi:mRNA interferase MazF
MVMTRNPKRGDVWWAIFEDRRAVVLLSEDGPEFQAMQVVPPAETPIDGVAVEVPIGRSEGLAGNGVLRVALPRPGQINCTWLATVTPSDLVEWAGEVAPQKLEAVERLLRQGEGA